MSDKKMYVYWCDQGHETFSEHGPDSQEFRKGDVECQCGQTFDWANYIGVAKVVAPA